MKFLAGEFLGLMGGVGLVYDSLLGGIATWIITAIITILAIIGLITVIWFLAGGIWKNRKKREETDGQYWLRTGKVKK